MILTLDQIRDLIHEEEADERDYVHLTSNETLLSPLAQETLASPLGNRYLLEHNDMRQDSPSRLNGFVFKGLDRVNAIERSATEVCRALFGADYVEFRCLSGLHAMQTTMAALTRPGDKVMRFGVADGGHFATESIIKLYGRESCTYAFDRAALTIDLEGTAEVFRRERPTLLYLDAMNYLFPFPIRELKAIVGDVPIVYDASHTLGLIAGGQFQNPLDEGADILQANTHKTLFGPQKGIILSRNRELMERVTYHLSQGLVSSQHTASLLSLCIALHETHRWGATYARQVVENAAFLASELAARGVPVLARADGAHTANHHFFINLTGRASASHMMARLLAARLSVQRTVPLKDTDALRVGVQEVTRRGITRGDLTLIASWFAEILLHDARPEGIAPHAIELARRYPQVLFCDSPNGQAATPRARHFAHTPKRQAHRWVDFERLAGEAKVPDDTLAGLHALGRVSGAFPNQTDASGNLSARVGEDVVVTASGSYIKALGPEHFVRLVEYRRGADLQPILQYVGGAVPSSESLMHYLIYQTTDAGAVAHTHYLLTNAEAAALDVAIVPPQEYASVALAEAVAEAARHRAVVYVQKHGLIFHAADAAACQALIEDFIQRQRGLTVAAPISNERVAS